MEINQQKILFIESVLEKYLPKVEGYQKTVLDAMRYSVMAGGKRLRSRLMLETYQLFGGKNNGLIEPFLVAIELIHTYSLVHDDLPAMDNDEYRRGRKTTHVVYGEAMGILTGDGLLNYAFEIVTNSFESTQYLEQKCKAMRVLSQKAGIYGMIGGQVVDVESSDKQIDIDTLLFIYELKTSALIEASMLVGAILAGASLEQQEIIQKVAIQIGMAFQIQDDILDVTSTQEVLGKPIKSDERNKKTTYVSMKGLERAKEEVLKRSTQAIELLETLPYSSDSLCRLITTLVHREK